MAHEQSHIINLVLSHFSLCLEILPFLTPLFNNKSRFTPQEQNIFFSVLQCNHSYKLHCSRSNNAEMCSCIIPILSSIVTQHIRKQDPRDERAGRQESSFKDLLQFLKQSDNTIVLIYPRKKEGHLQN